MSDLREFPIGAQQLLDRGSEGRPAPGDDAGVLADLRVRNIAEAVIHGGLKERARLGALIGELLTGGLEGKR